MKTLPSLCIITILLGTGIYRVQASPVGPSPTPYTAVSRDANTCTWERNTYKLLPSGQVVTNLHRYVELATGLNYKDNSGQWTPSREEIDVYQGGAIAQYGQHKVIFGNNLNTAGSIDVQMPDGKESQSDVLGLAYYDSAGGQSVVIAETKDCQGQIVNSNQVVYANAFQGVQANVQYTYTKAGLEQDVILLQQPPPPESFGLSSTSLVLQVVTEFTSAPTPNVHAHGKNSSLPDEDIDFGSMHLAHGKAFLLGSSAQPTTVSRQWVNQDGRNLLFESVPLTTIVKGMKGLPVAAKLPRSNNHGSVLDVVSRERLLPAPRMAKVENKKMELALGNEAKQGYVLDYYEVDGDYAYGSLDFQAGTTYFVSGSVFCYDEAVTFEGGAVIKYPNDTTAEIDIDGCPVNWQTGPYHPVIFTAGNDDTVGEWLEEDGPPYIVAEADPALEFDFEYPGSMHDVRICYAQIAVDVDDASDFSMTNVQLVNCEVGIDSTWAEDATNTIALTNCLIVSPNPVDGPASAALAGGGSVTTYNLENCSIDSFNELVGDGVIDDSSAGNLCITNSIISNIGDWGDGNLGGSGDYFNSTPDPFGDDTQQTIDWNPYDDVEGGDYYPDPYFGGNADPDDYSGQTITENTTLGPYTYNSNVGYNYPRVDYIFEDTEVSANLTFQPGTVVMFEDQGIQMEGGYTVTFQGQGANPCYFVSGNSVQENDQTGDSVGMIDLSGSDWPSLNATFTKFSSPGDVCTYTAANSLYANFYDCEIYGGMLGGYYSDGLDMELENCLLDGPMLYMFGNLHGTNSSLQLQNCTMHAGEIYATWTDRFSGVMVADSAFDGEELYVGSSTNSHANFTSKNDAYLTGATKLPNDASDVTVTNFNWQSSWFGNFYLSTNSALINAGNTNANLLGLYHFTTQTNQVIEGTSIVDIGYHYVATGTNGVPLDSNGDGIPDYLEDANGDGLVDDGETNWALSILSQPASQIAIQGSNAVLSVIAAGVAPLKYQWVFNGTNIAGGTNDALTLNDVQISNRGDYWVIVTNYFGSITSSAALLDVSVPPVISQYQVLYGTVTNFTFRADTTYLISGSVYCAGNTVIEGGTVIKYCNDTNSSIEIAGGIDCETGPYHPAVFTAADDDSVGKSMNGIWTNYTGIVSTNNYANPAIQLDQYTNQMILHDLRFTYAALAININYVANFPFTLAFRDLQIVNCTEGIFFPYSEEDDNDSYFTLNNCLIAHTKYAAEDDLQDHVHFVFAYCTVDNCSQVDFIPNGAYDTLNAYNSIFANVGVYGVSDFGYLPGSCNNGFYNNASGDFGDSSIDYSSGPPASPFVTEIGGNYYLSDNTFRGQATTYIPDYYGFFQLDPTMMAELTQKTTHPPIVFTNAAYLTPTNFVPQALRDTNDLDLGYHYDPLDYIFAGCQTVSNMTFSAGVGAGWFRITSGLYHAGEGIALLNGGSITLNGTATEPVYWVRCNTVQEQDLSGGYGPAGIADWATNSYNVMAIQARFAHCVAMNSDVTSFFGDDGGFLNVYANACEFDDNGLAGNLMSLDLTNCLFDRDFVAVQSTNNSSRLVMRNCTIHGGNLYVERLNGSSWPVRVENSAFDGTSLGDMDNPLPGNTNVTYGNNNAFLQGSNRLIVLGPQDVIVTNSFGWQVSWFGNYYLPPNSPLIDHGSTTADRIGLYHFTTQTNQSPEGISVVDIGYHYVATDSNGLPLDSNGDGIPDYLEDVNGNGLWDPGESPWGLAPTITQQPQNQTVVLGGNAGFTTVASGSVPLNYQWGFNGTNIGAATNITLMLTNVQLAQLGNYFVVVTNTFGSAISSNADLILAPSKLIAWGDDSQGQIDIPPGLSNVMQVAAGVYHSLVLNEDGTVTAWGMNTYGQATVPPGLSNVVAIAAGGYHSLALRTDGTVVAWGDNEYAQTYQAFFPYSLSNVVAIAGGYFHSLALEGDGSIVAWGDDTFGQVNIPAGLTNAIAIAAGGNHNLALTANGTVVAWGLNDYGQTNVPYGLTNVVAIAAGELHSLALKANGTVVAWGCDNFGEVEVPSGLTNIIAIGAGGEDSLALKSDGTVIAWGYNNFGETNVPWIVTRALKITAGGFHNMALSVGITNAVVAVQPPIQSAYVGGQVQFTAFISDPRITGSSPVNYQWQFNGTNIAGATNAVLTLTNVQLFQAGSYGVKVSSVSQSYSSYAAGLTVLNGQPVISEQPTNQTDLLGSAVNLCAGADGTAPLSYQWYLNGVPISGATNATLTLEPLQYNQAGSYSVLVTNIFGSVLSSNMTLNVALSQVLDWGGDTGGETNLPPGLTNVVAISAGVYHTLAIKSDGTVVTWGSMDPVPSFATNVTTVAAGNGYSLILRADGTIASWGNDVNGTTNIPPGITATAISAGYLAALALQPNRTVVAWGDNSYGEGTVPSGLTNVIAIAAGGIHNLALKGNGTVVAWGYNNDGQISVPPGLSNVVAIAAGLYHSVALKADGTVAAWGDDSRGQTNVPVGLTNVIAISAGGYHSLALRSDGTVIAWGDYTVPQTIVPRGLVNAVAVSAGYEQSVVLVNSGMPFITHPPVSQSVLVGTTSTNSVQAMGLQPLAYQWAFNGTNISWATNNTLTLTNVQFSQAGDYSVIITNALGNVTNFNAELAVVHSLVVRWGDNTYVPAGLPDISAIAAGAYFDLALETDGAVAAWGDNSAGESDVPPGLTNVTTIAANDSHCLAVNANGTVTAWGDDSAGESDVPPGLTNAIAIAAGSYHSLALKGDGTVIAWGFDIFGQTNVPPGLSNVVAITSAYDDCVALKADGTVVAWGLNNEGQTNVPAGLSNVVAVAGGVNHFLALRADGTVKSWGFNNNGQTNVPVGLSNVVAIAGGGYHSLAVEQNGTVVAWGDNNEGQTNVPIGLSNVVAVAGGMYHSLALINDGRPFITVSPFNQTANVGGQPRFYVRAAGTSPLNYQWQLDGTNIFWATNTSLTLTNVQASQAGFYSVTVTNTTGAITSGNAVLTIQ